MSLKLPEWSDPGRGGVMDWIRAEYFWLIVGVILLMLEFIVPGVILVFFGVGGIITAILVWTGVLTSRVAQLAVFGVSSLVLLFALRRYLSRHFKGRVSRQAEYDDRAEYVGKSARVIRKIIPNSAEGRIDFEGAEWKAVAAEVIEEGSLVRIVEKDNITFAVKALTEKGDR